MQEELPWETMQNSMYSFAHDSLNLVHFSLQSIRLAEMMSKSPELDALILEAGHAGKAIGEIHKIFGAFRRSEDPPTNLATWIANYRRALKKRNAHLTKVIGKIKAFRRKAKMNAEVMTKLDKGIGFLTEFQRQYPAKALGRKISAKLEARNLYRDLRDYLSQSFVDREGKPVKVIFKGTNIGDVRFDQALLRRGLFNLVTDALNHSPGRPIYVTLKASNGRATINVTNHGKKLKPSEIAKIGRVRFTRAWHDPRRGYGKISTRILTEAQGGSFHAGNSRIGPMLSIRLQRAKKQRRRVH
ncbi:MAG: sensor histidine kinase [Candidatus Diapherotrites archaeon]|nr:sensor histidine kinase [Candidatus Diapherotrites archaeon]